MKRRKRHSHPYAEGPQQYQPRVEIAIEAIGHALMGCQTLVRFLLQQEGPEWRHAGRLLDAADGDLRRARFWLKKRSPAEGRKDKHRESLAQPAPGRGAGRGCCGSRRGARARVAQTEKKVRAVQKFRRVRT